jgi:ferrochelatase
MEVRHDLDVEAKDTAARLGLPMERAATPGTDPRFVAMITGLVRERLDPEPASQRALGPLGPACNTCPTGCCVPVPR